MYRLLGNHCSRTSAYGADYGLYMHALARDIKCIPNVFYWMYSSWRVGLGYSLGQAMMPYFRLEGPFASSSATKVCEEELWAPVANRSIVANGIFVVLGVIFGGLSLVCWIVDTLTKPIISLFLKS